MTIYIYMVIYHGGLNLEKNHDGSNLKRLMTDFVKIDTCYKQMRMYMVIDHGGFNLA